MKSLSSKSKKVWCGTSRGARTHDHKIKSLALYRLSFGTVKFNRAVLLGELFTVGELQIYNQICLSLWVVSWICQFTS